MEKVASKSREIYADILRIIAAFSVVFQHTASSAWYFTPVRTDDWITLNFYNSIARFGVGVFILISGAFMLSPRYSHSPHKIFTKNLPRILLLLLFWVVLYGIVDVVTEGGNILDVFATPLLLFTEPPTHLWFLYTLAGLYVLTPPLRVFTEHASPRMVLYVIGIFFCFGLLLPMVNHLLEMVADFTLYKNIRIQGCTTFAGFYLTGFYLAHYGLKPLARKALYIAAVVSWAMAFVSSTFLSIDRAKPNEYFLGNFQPTTFLIAAGIFCFFRSHYGEKENRSRWIKELSVCMLGVYLVHPLFLKAFYELELSLLDPHPIIAVPVTATLFFVLSLGITLAIRQLPFFKKYM